MRARAITSLLLVWLTGCHTQPAPIARCRELVRLSERNAAADARSALKAGDSLLLSLGGFSPVTPGAEDRTGNLRFRQLPGTTDSETPACLDLRPIAERYAKLYNQTIVAGIGDAR
jgi:hypothetical protein